MAEFEIMTDRQIKISFIMKQGFAFSVVSLRGILNKFQFDKLLATQN
jgi:hypothetical protein